MTFSSVQYCSLSVMTLAAPLSEPTARGSVTYQLAAHMVLSFAAFGAAHMVNTVGRKFTDRKRGIEQANLLAERSR